MGRIRVFIHSYNYVWRVSLKCAAKKETEKNQRIKKEAQSTV